MGEAGEIEPETEAFLMVNDIEFGEFPPEALDCLLRTDPGPFHRFPTLNFVRSAYLYAIIYLVCITYRKFTCNFTMIYKLNFVCQHEL